MKSKYHFSFEDLIVYQKAIEFAEIVNQLIQKFPKHEMFNLYSQFQRAVDSIGYNIAEGSSGSAANFNRYLQIAWESTHESVCASTKARLRNYITFEEDEKNRKRLTEISKMLTLLKKHFISKINKKE
ncbi:MAG: four helix bundle protein [Flavobacteriaceae bacterium CG_4_8_14_3_um_filter_34_10]|nr:four helix bundle protein [Flavobacteriia bacterium]PIQ18522.1 MAG: four helix bundle protein [Flavobacteriaceae bacterium CG18_big_fil_WC_8_21_14_2_50_34_36]PIV49824.1 MAG: four helix bundle protein [Flavobacteriaceae bacterium CG02_land_8_20_14_3_00_34_13]PIX08769.1 MAG: four helix bundle protein [Flavobacteriaceae bacterium CG_4_8_14_3_um_filter_34_10]PIZ07086.1 MAG: four helix bundle protein [Flavobacteriaceae bacterium CG_4_10_14_0_8_um_filter_34_31]PJC06057.1 MAG: four helix bundle pr